VPKNPGRYNPLGKPTLVAQRKDVVLKRMQETGMINSRQYKKLRNHPVKVVPVNQAPTIWPISAAS
jgi:membrane peptidoglycan carboxypeptidase